jgi:hypothetical protein
MTTRGKGSGKKEDCGEVNTAAAAAAAAAVTAAQHDPLSSLLISPPWRRCKVAASSLHTTMLAVSS